MTKWWTSSKLLLWRIAPTPCDLYRTLYLQPTTLTLNSLWKVRASNHKKTVLRVQIKMAQIILKVNLTVLELRANRRWKILLQNLLVNQRPYSPTEIICHSMYPRVSSPLHSRHRTICSTSMTCSVSRRSRSAIT